MSVWIQVPLRFWIYAGIKLGCHTDVSLLIPTTKGRSLLLLLLLPVEHVAIRLPPPPELHLLPDPSVLQLLLQLKHRLMRNNRVSVQRFLRTETTEPGIKPLTL